jgi:hypothetical protein
MALCFSHQGILYLVLDEENVARIQQHDPFDFNQGLIGGPITLAIPLSVVVAYARADEHALITTMSTTDVVKYLRRGYQETASDHERSVTARIRPVQGDS